MSFVLALRNIIDLTDNYIYLIFKFKQYKNVNFANFVYYGKTRIQRGWNKEFLWKVVFNLLKNPVINFTSNAWCLCDTFENYNSCLWNSQTRQESEVPCNCIGKERVEILHIKLLTFLLPLKSLFFSCYNM